MVSWPKTAIGLEDQTKTDGTGTSIPCRALVYQEAPGPSVSKLSMHLLEPQRGIARKWLTQSGPATRRVLFGKAFHHLVHCFGLPGCLFSSLPLDSLFQIGLRRRRGPFAQRSHFRGELRLPLPDAIHNDPELAIGPAGEMIEGHKH